MNFLGARSGVEAEDTLGEMGCRRQVLGVFPMCLLLKFMRPSQRREAKESRVEEAEGPESE